MRNVMKCIVMAAVAALPVSAVPAGAGGLSLYVAPQRDVHDNYGRAVFGLGVTVPVGVLELKALGEVGASARRETRMDSRVELTAGYPFGTDSIRVTPFGGGGHRRWTAEWPFASNIESTYLATGIGVTIEPSSRTSFFGEVAAQHLAKSGEWSPRAEVGMVLAVMRYSLTYEKLRQGNGSGPDIVGIKMGVSF